jgi:hypothetical protein
MKEEEMRPGRDFVIAVGIGVVWAVVVLEAIGFLAATGPGRLPEMDALARGDAMTFIVVALLGDAAIYAVPSLLAGYLMVRLMERPMPFAFVAGVLPFLFGAYSVILTVAEGSPADAIRVYLGLNAILLLLAIPAGVALIQWSARFMPGAAPRAS